jgi:hypothetical protein
MELGAIKQSFETQGSPLRRHDPIIQRSAQQGSDQQFSRHQIIRMHTETIPSAGASHYLDRIPWVRCRSGIGGLGD